VYNTVFLSHSKKDENTNFFHKIFSGLDTNLITMELETIDTPPAFSIKKKIKESNALFVLLSDHLLKLQHTGIWIAFEVGLACNKEINALETHNLGMDIFVFEPLNSHVNFPIPYCKYYMPLEFIDEEIKYLRDLMQNINKLHGMGKVTCKNEKCKLKFQTLSRMGTDFNCPSCKKVIEFKEYQSTAHDW
jgi:hypothetical protein